MEISLTRGLVALVDDCDFPLVSSYRWRAVFEYRKRYVYAISGKKTPIRMHRLIVGALPGQLVDHRNGQTLDNRRCNLRICNNAQNSQNRVGTRSGYKGVTWHKQARKWQALAKRDGKAHYLGLFENEIDAALAYDKAAIQLFGEFARTNFKDLSI